VSFGGWSRVVLVVVVVSMCLRNPVRTEFPSGGPATLVPRLSATAATRAVSTQTSLARPSRGVLCRWTRVAVVGATSGGVPRSAWRR
jgi:hypothetical protein